MIFSAKCIFQNCFVASLRHLARLVCMRKNSKFLYSAVASHWDFSKHFQLYTLEDLLVEHYNKFFWERFSHAPITRRLFVHKKTPTTLFSHVPVFTFG